MKRITLFFVFVTAFVVGLSFSPAPSDAYTPPLPPVVPERRALEREIVVFVDVPIQVAPNVVAGMRAWERATRGWRRWRLGAITEANLWIVQVEPGRNPCPSWAVACAGNLGGLEKDDDSAWGRAWLIRGQYETGATVITIHEIGHSLGLAHAEGTVMNAEITLPMLLQTWRCPDGESLLRLQWRLGVVLDSRECVE